MCGTWHIVRSGALCTIRQRLGGTVGVGGAILRGVAAQRRSKSCRGVSTAVALTMDGVRGEGVQQRGTWHDHTLGGGSERLLHHPAAAVEGAQLMSVVGLNAIGMQLTGGAFVALGWAPVAPPQHTRLQFVFRFISSGRLDVVLTSCAARRSGRAVAVPAASCLGSYAATGRTPR